MFSYHRPYFTQYNKMKHAAVYNFYNTDLHKMRN